MRRVGGYASNDSSEDNNYHAAKGDIEEWLPEERFSNESNSASSVIRQGISENIGKYYFCGMIRMDHTRFFKFIFLWELVQNLNTIIRFCQIFVSRKTYAIDSEDYMLNFMGWYFFLGNLVPTVIILMVIMINKKIASIK